MTLERMITTDMSANIVAGLLKRRWTIARIARTIDAPLEFVEGVRAKRHVLTVADIKALANQTGETPAMMIFDSITDIPSRVRPLFDVTRQSLAASAKLATSLKRSAKGRSEHRKVRAQERAA